MLRILMAKDIRRWWSDRNAVIITLLLPMVLTTILGFSFGGFGDGPPISTIPLAVVGDVPSQLRDMIGQALTESEMFNISWVDSAQALQMIETGDVSAALLLPDDLMADMFSGQRVEIGLWKDPTSLLKAGIIEQIIQRMLLQYNAGEAVYYGKWPQDWYVESDAETDPIGDFFSSSSSFLDVYRDIKNGTPEAKSAWEMIQTVMDHQVVLSDAMSRPILELSVEDRRGHVVEQASQAPASYNAFDYILPGMAVFFLMFAASAAGGDLHREKSGGTMQRLLTAPLDGMELVTGKWLYAMVNGTMQLAVLLLAGRLLFRVHLGPDLITIPILVLLTSAALASFFLPLALLTRNEKQMGQISTGLVLLMAMLGGNFMNVDALPQFMLVFSRMTPNYWANTAFNSIIAYRQGLSDILPNLGMLAGFTVFFLLISLLLLKRRGGREALL
jgi:ABC-type multidrug transport system permease subunit